jgi:hypothetical protein
MRLMVETAVGLLVCVVVYWFGYRHGTEDALRAMDEEFRKGASKPIVTGAEVKKGLSAREMLEKAGRN